MCPPGQEASKDEQHFCISDYKKQDAAVVHRNMDQVIAHLRASGKLKEHGTVKQVRARGAHARRAVARQPARTRSLLTIRAPRAPRR